MGPTVVVPPQHLMAPSGASEIATGFETARHNLDTHALPGTPGSTPAETSVTDKYAYAFVGRLRSTAVGIFADLMRVGY